MKSITFVALAVLVCAASGCATIMHGTSQEVRVDSSPRGAECRSGNSSVVTPGFLKLDRGAEHHVVCKLEGYRSSGLSVTPTHSGWIFLNLLPIIGTIVDFVDGAAYNLHPEQAMVYLSPGSDPAEAAVLAAVIITSEDPMLRQKLTEGIGLHWKVVSKERKFAIGPIIKVDAYQVWVRTDKGSIPFLLTDVARAEQLENRPVDVR
ncbi:MAG: hypothetical protein WC943_13385 [Elusimicrobiota bacterium]|jgi:hypothetical protein